MHQDSCLLSEEQKAELIRKLLDNAISLDELLMLSMCVSAKDLSDIVRHIYDLSQAAIDRIGRVGGVLKTLDAMKNGRRNNAFRRKIAGKFGDQEINSGGKVILAEGDSWFNYPVILTDIVDRLCSEKKMAVYSIAEGGEWLLNMLNEREYVEELSVLHPDVFLISGGGNDLVGSRRLAAIVQSNPDKSEFEKNEFCRKIITLAEKGFVPLNQPDFEIGIAHLSKDFFALLMLFFLQYNYMIRRIIFGGKDNKRKFPGIRVLTQGYDFPIPSDASGLGLNPFHWYVPFIRKFFGHGKWLKIPLRVRGITDAEIQRKILYAMIYLFNEMMIYTGYRINWDVLVKLEEKENRVFHIDSRGSVGKEGWTDELHPKPVHFRKTGEIFAACILERVKPSYGAVFVVNSL